jgi:small subunit ribosomal protein S7e
MAEGYLSKLIVKRGKLGEPVADAKPSAIDVAVAKALHELQSSASSELAGELQVLQVHGAREVDLPTAGRKTIVVVVPVPQLKAWRRIQSRVTRELEKKFGDQPVCLVAMRRILPPQRRGQPSVSKQQRPRSRTLTAVHDAWLEDMLYPTDIVGKRTRVRTDGSRLLKVFLDPRDQALVEGKLDAYAAVYKKLTGKQVAFEFPLTVDSTSAPN